MKFHENFCRIFNVSKIGPGLNGNLKLAFQYLLRLEEIVLVSKKNIEEAREKKILMKEIKNKLVIY